MTFKNSNLTVVIPTKNRYEQTINAVRSAVKSPYIDEIIIVDDGSNFNLDLYYIGCSEFKNSNVKILNNYLLSGAQGSRMTGILEASSDIILFLDSDDLLVSENVEKLFNVISSDQQIVLTYGKIKFGNTISNWLILNGNCYSYVLKNLSLCPFSGLFIRKSLIDWSQLTLALPAWQDDDLCILASRSGKLAFVDEIIAENNLSDDSISRSYFKQYTGLVILLKKYKSEIIKTCGLHRLFLWRLRQISLYFFVLSEKILEKSNKSNFLIKTPFIVISNSLKVIGKSLSVFLRIFFDRIYC